MPLSTAKRIKRRRPADMVRTGARFLAVFLLILAGGFAVLSKTRPDLAQQARQVGDEALTPILHLVSGPVSFFRSIGDDIESYLSVRDRNLELEGQLQDFARLERSVERLEAENLALKERLHVTAWPAEVVATARVVGAGGGPFVRSVLIDAGRRFGVERETAVVDKNGVVGRVIGSGQLSARVLLLTDLNSRIPVRLQRTGDTGILLGNNRDQPEIRFLPLDAEVAAGDRIVTSGHGGVFPPDLPVGVVAYADNDVVRIEPYAELGRLSYLTILRMLPMDGGQVIERQDPETLLSDVEQQ